MTSPPPPADSGPRRVHGDRAVPPSRVGHRHARHVVAGPDLGPGRPVVPRPLDRAAAARTRRPSAPGSPAAPTATGEPEPTRCSTSSEPGSSPTRPSPSPARPPGDRDRHRPFTRGRPRTHHRCQCHRHLAARTVRQPMTATRPSRPSRPLLGDRGSITAELVIVTPVALALLCLVALVGRTTDARSQVDEAARDAARAASIARDPSDAQTVAQRSADHRPGTRRRLPLRHHQRRSRRVLVRARRPGRGDRHLQRVDSRTSGSSAWPEPAPSPPPPVGPSTSTGPPPHDPQRWPAKRPGRQDEAGSATLWMVFATIIVFAVCGLGLRRRHPHQRPSNSHQQRRSRGPRRRPGHRPQHPLHRRPGPTRPDQATARADAFLHANGWTGTVTVTATEVTVTITRTQP